MLVAPSSSSLHCRGAHGSVMGKVFPSSRSSRAWSTKAVVLKGAFLPTLGSLHCWEKSKIFKNKNKLLFFYQRNVTLIPVVMLKVTGTYIYFFSLFFSCALLYNPKMKVWLPFPKHHLPSLLLSGVSPSFLQAATLSHHQICVGNIPDCSRACRLVFLNNTSESKAVVFAWKTSNVKESGVSGSFSLLCSAQGTGGGSLLCHIFALPLRFHPDTGETSWKLDFVPAVERKGQRKVEAGVG